jgi:branched-chain amino acid transport system ATP-binding protein
MSLLEIKDLHVAYGKVEAVLGVSLNVEEKQIVTVIGANGAGKSTLLNATAGLLAPASEIIFKGENLSGLTPEARLERGLCLVPEKRELFSTMSVEDNLLLGGFLRTTQERKVGFEEVYSRFPRLKERKAQLAGTLSGGERQMLALGRALMSKPQLLMLDEPSLGLAPKIVADIFKIIVDLNAAGVSILLIEQNARAALNVAHHAYVMELGEVKMQGLAKDLAANEELARSYLGF